MGAWPGSIAPTAARGLARKPCDVIVSGMGRVLGVIPALIANFQALEAIKLLIGESPSLAGKLLRFNGNEMKFHLDEIKRNERCKVCS